MREKKSRETRIPGPRLLVIWSELMAGERRHALHPGIGAGDFDVRDEWAGIADFDSGGKRGFEIALDPDAFDAAGIDLASKQGRPSVGRYQGDHAGNAGPAR